MPKPDFEQVNSQKWKGVERTASGGLPETIELWGRGARTKERLGYANLTFYKEPMAFCYVNEVQSGHAHVGEGYGLSIIQSLTEYIQQRKVRGLAVVQRDRTPARGMFKDLLWSEVPMFPDWLTLGFSDFSTLSPAESDRQLAEIRAMIAKIPIESDHPKDEWLS